MMTILHHKKNNKNYLIWNYFDFCKKDETEVSKWEKFTRAMMMSHTI